MIDRNDKVLYIDPKNQYLEEKNIISIHPSKLHWLLKFEKGVFDKAVVKNTDLNYLKAISLFRIGQPIKKGGIIEIFVDQPISIMQSMDAAEIESESKLAGYTDVSINKSERWENIDGKDLKISNIKITLVVADKMKFNEIQK